MTSVFHLNFYMVPYIYHVKYLCVLNAGTSGSQCCVEIRGQLLGVSPSFQTCRSRVALGSAAMYPLVSFRLA